MRMPVHRLAACLLLGLAASAPAGAAPALAACRLEGVEHDAWCGRVARPLDPARPSGPQIDVHYAVLPALARGKKPDPVFFLAGGPGQSAISLAGPVSRLLARFSNRRDIVLVDQRGTGRSAPLQCEDETATRPLRESLDSAAQRAALADCRLRLQALPHGDLRQYATTIAMHDLEAVRQALGVPRVNLVGGSYGTRAALEYQRLYPQHVRRAVLDGVAPPDMVLPLSFSTDAQAAFEALFAACEAEAACRTRHAGLRARWQALLATLPREVNVRHPFTGTEERVTLTREGLAGLLRPPLYAPLQASALPQAMAEAVAGRFEPLFALASAGSGRREQSLAAGQHFSVVCAEDQPRAAGSGDAPGADFGDASARLYAEVCAGWPRAAVDPAFYAVPAARTPVLLLSGAVDPATPPRHAERVARALGANARHAVVPNAGHGVIGLPCLRDTVFRFVDAETDAEALALDLGCAARVPRPPAFVPPGAGGVR